MENITEESYESKRIQFHEILREEKIYPVYQPIVSLRDGEILGYEALSRIQMQGALLNQEEMFRIAEEEGCLWLLEELCRRKSLQNAVNKKNGVKLFLNVDPNVIKDPLFREGMTHQYLKQYGFLSEDIVFEITERNSIEDMEGFSGVIEHYRSQVFQIAIDDFGDGYAGMNRICVLMPEYIKIDMKIIRDIDKDNLKKSLVESMIHFCEKENISLIAEGIETKEELQTLIKLGVHYGQGYYLLRPQPELQQIPLEVLAFIKNTYDGAYTYNAKGNALDRVGDICKCCETTEPERMAKEIFCFLQEKALTTELAVLNEEKKVMGVLTRAAVNATFGGMYGYDLYAKRSVAEIMDKNPLVVDCDDSVEAVSRMALARPQRTLYDAVIVTKEERYLGVVTVKDLLEAAIMIQVHRAVEINPLTGLPGNTAIEENIKRTIKEKEEYAIAYIDLDNFKAYNDAYGFNNGDLMIKALAESMKEYCVNNEFMGHVGGDDFVLIAYYSDVMPLLQQITECFSRKIVPLYSREDYQRGVIVSHNRRGGIEEFPIVTLSVAVITNGRRRFANMEDFSEHLVKTKKKSKAIVGNSFVFDE